MAYSAALPAYSEVKLEQHINDELEQQHFLQQLTAINQTERDRIKASTQNQFKLFMDFVFHLLDEQEEKLSKIDAADAENDKAKAPEPGPGPSSSSASVGDSGSRPSTISSLIQYFTAFRSGESGADAVDDETGSSDDSKDQDEKADADDGINLNFIPAFTMSALTLKETRKTTAEFKKLIYILNSIKSNQEEMLQAQKAANSLQKVKWITAKEKLEVEKEKLAILKEYCIADGNACRSSKAGVACRAAQ